ncbi:hypothetical protein L218DRAFT_956045 [Marasmius fiardii PR-910]|nr:hypothetical protein L218DRAFT_956045 [Marasmius fiardii PR-910]
MVFFIFAVGNSTKGVSRLNLTFRSIGIIPGPSPHRVCNRTHRLPLNCVIPIASQASWAPEG